MRPFVLHASTAVGGALVMMTLVTLTVRAALSGPRPVIRRGLDAASAVGLIGLVVVVSARFWVLR